MASTPGKHKTPPGRSSAAKQIDSESVISPKMRELLPTPKSAGSYGCQREVYHPLSPNAEPSALLFYDSSEDPDEEENAAETPSRLRIKKQEKGKQVENLAARVQSVGVSADDSQKNLTESPGRSNNQRRKPGHVSRSSLSEISLLSSPSAKKRLAENPSSPTKRNRNSETIFAGRVLDYGNNLDSASAGGRGDPRTPQKTSPLPAISPRGVALPDSPAPSEVNSLLNSPVLSIEGSPVLEDRFSPAVARRNLKHKNASALDAEEITNKLQILNIKAQEYSEAVTYTPADRQFQKELEQIYNSKDRFDPAEAKILEDVWQSKIHAVVEKEKQRIHELHLAEQAKLEAERKAIEQEKARKAAEELRRQQEGERLRRQHEEERQRQLAEEARQQAEAERAEQEKRRQAEEKARQEAAARERAARATQLAQQQQQQQQQQQDAQQQQQAIQQASPQLPTVYGRINVETEDAAITRVMSNLKAMKHEVKNTPNMAKGLGLLQAIRDLRPKVAQLTGDKKQTVASRNAMKAILLPLMNAGGPTRGVADFLLYPDPANGAQVSIAYIFVLNELAKIIRDQVTSEASARIMTADPIGVLICSTFADAALLIGGKSVIDIFVCRLLKKCPPLRWKLGPETTEDDQFRMGRLRNENGTMEADAEYLNRIRGLSSGYAAIAGRDFGSSTLVNMYPMFNLWNRMSFMLNAPAEALTEAHYECMKTIIMGSGSKMVQVYGVQARKLITLAITSWAQAGMQHAPSGATALKSLETTLRNETWWNR